MCSLSKRGFDRAFYLGSSHESTRYWVIMLRIGQVYGDEWVHVIVVSIEIYNSIERAWWSSAYSF